MKTHPFRPLDAARAFGVVFGGPIVLAVSAAMSVAAFARAAVCLRRPPSIALLGTALTALYVFAIRPWHLRWGTRQRMSSAGYRAMSSFPRTGRRSATR